MSRKKKKADVVLRIDLGSGHHLEVHGDSFEFLRKTDTGIVSAAVGLTRAQMDKALETLCEAGVITPPLTAEQKAYELDQWIAANMLKDAINGVDVEEEEVHVVLHGDGVLFEHIAAMTVKIEQLYPGKKVYFQ